MSLVVLTVCGSFHPGSANRSALDCASAALQTRSEIRVHDATPIDQLPALDPELFDAPPAAVARFRAQVDEAQRVILAAPEYAGGLAGSVKNALDWCVGSGSFYRKPVVVMSAGSSGGPHA